ncbi:MAG: hypothetical protein HOQ44_07910 [Nocardia sp.]|nr:hypothetical protein [Nocardia sp.]
MTGEGEGREREPDRADFGPPTGDFGPPVSEFGPPTGELPAPGWKPTSRPEDSGLTWRPAPGAAPEPPPVPPPAPQYRAPESSTPVYRPAPTDSRPVPRPASGAPDPDATVRHQIPPEPTARNTSERAPESEQATVRHQSGPDLRWPSPNQPNQPGGTDQAAGSARPRAGGLSWDSDPIAQKLTPQSVAGALSQKPRRKIPVGRIVTAVAVLVAVVAVGVAIVEVSGGDDEPSAPPVADSALSCPASEEGGVIVGDGVGDTTSGAGAILGFQHQFYVERSGVGARQFVAADSPAISSAETIQDAIETHIPVGTEHCVRITERAPASFDVDLTELQPGGKKTVYKQTVTTVDRDGKTVLWVIADRR